MQKHPQRRACSIHPARFYHLNFWSLHATFGIEGAGCGAHYLQLLFLHFSMALGAEMRKGKTKLVLGGEREGISLVLFLCCILITKSSRLRSFHYSQPLA